MSENQMLDLIDSAHMTQGSSTNFTSDRFGNSNSALGLNGGWTQVPSGVYFNTPEFTISLWVMPRHCDKSSRIIDFGNGPARDNIVFSISGAKRLPRLHIYSGENEVIYLESNEAFKADEWQFLTSTFNGTHARIYINGQLTAETIKSYSLPTLSRSNCYIGKSNWPEDGYSQSFLDDLRFYNKSLTQDEIIELMDEKAAGKILNMNLIISFKIF